MLVDIATGRYLPGDEIDAQVVAREHGLRPVDVRIALYDLRRAGLVTGVPFSGTRVVVWHRRTNEALMRRLGRVLAGVAAASPVLEALPEPAETRLPAAALLVRHGLALPADVEHFLDLARTMVDTLPADERVRVHSELLLPLTVLSTTTCTASCRRCPRACAERSSTSSRRPRTTATGPTCRGSSPTTRSRSAPTSPARPASPPDRRGRTLFPHRHPVLAPTPRRGRVPVRGRGSGRDGRRAGQRREGSRAAPEASPATAISTSTTQRPLSSPTCSPRNPITGGIARKAT